MIRFYNAAIEMQPKGSAVLFREPALKGQVLFSVADGVNGDCQRLYVCDANEEEHGQNLGLAKVSEIGEEAAVRLAADYQPARSVPHLNPQTREVETVEIPACDLKSLLHGGQTGAIGGQLLGEEPA